MDAGVDKQIRETLLSSIELARDVLMALGHTKPEANEAVLRFRQHDEALLERQHKIYHDEAQLIAAARKARKSLNDCLKKTPRQETSHDGPSNSDKEE